MPSALPTPAPATLGTLRVVQTVATLSACGGGVARVVASLADALADAGCESIVVHMRAPNGALAQPVRSADLRGTGGLIRGARAIWSPTFGTTIAAALATPLPGIIHDNGLWGATNIAAARAARKLGVPLVISPHGMLEPWALEHRRRRKLLAMAAFQRGILESASMFMVSAAPEASSVRAAGLRQPIAIVPPGVMLPAAVARHEAHAGAKRVLFLSRIHPGKGLIALIEAWAQLRPEGWEAIVAGPDEDGHRAELERLLAKRNLQHAFRFTGEADAARKLELFTSSDLFVLPSFSENFGLVIAEALAHGLPVLATKAAPWQMLESTGAGWWVETGVRGLTAGLRQALGTTTEQRQRMGAAGRAFVAEHLDWASSARKNIEAYRWRLGLESTVPDHVLPD